MKLIKHTLPRNHNLFLFGDIHIGTTVHDFDAFEKFLDMMGKKYCGCKNNYAVCHGDIIEGIMIDDPRFHPATTEEMFPMLQLDEAVMRLSGIRRRLLCILEGNHERKLWRFGTIAGEIANRLDVPYGTYSAKLSYFDNQDNLMYKHYATHGRKSISSTADDPKRRITNMELVLKRHLKFKAADAVLMSKGHTHKLLISKPEYEMYMTDDGDKVVSNYRHGAMHHNYIHPDHRWYVNTGSFMRLYNEGGESGYAEIAEYDPVELGIAVAIVRDGRIEKVKKVVF